MLFRSFIGQLARGIRLHSTSLKVEPNSVLLGDGTGHLFMVADGMGGHQGGEEASRIAIEYFMTAILNRPQWNSLIARYGEDHQLRDELGAILNEAHQEIRRRSEADVSLAGMGTTFTMAYVMWPIMLVVHAGDTRCYLLRQGKLDLLTSDHTIANRMLQTGRLKAGPSERSPWANVLYNAQIGRAHV